MHICRIRLQTRPARSRRSCKIVRKFLTNLTTDRLQAQLRCLNHSLQSSPQIAGQRSKTTSLADQKLSQRLRILLWHWLPDLALKSCFLTRTWSIQLTLPCGIQHALVASCWTKLQSNCQKMVRFCTFATYIFQIKATGWVGNPLCFSTGVRRISPVLRKRSRSWLFQQPATCYDGPWLCGKNLFRCNRNSRFISVLFMKGERF